MIKSMYIGSADTPDLLAGLETKAYLGLCQSFMSGERRRFNAYASPIDALRIGQIIEDRYIVNFTQDNFYTQVRVVDETMNVFRATLDITELQEARVKSFIEVKSVGYCDFQDMLETSDLEGYVHSNYARYIKQVNEQLMCSGLESAEIHFIEVLNYNDKDNYERIINQSEVLPFTVHRDEKIIAKIRERGLPFQMFKNQYT